MKRFIKKLLPVLVGMLALSASTAFAQTTQEAKDVYAQLEAKSQAITDGNIYFQFNMTATDGQESLNMAYAMNALYKNMLNPNEMKLLSKNIIWIEDMEMPFTIWYADGYSYTDMMGEKMKTKVDMGQTMTQALAFSQTFGSSADLMTDLSLRTEEGNRILSYVMDDSKMNAYIQQIFSQAGLTQMLGGMEIKVRDINGAYILTDDNYYSFATLNMAMDFSMDGETLTIYLNGFMNNLNPGQPVEFDLPSAEGYTDIADTYSYE